MSRKVVYAVSNIVLDDNDCKTKKYLKIKISKTMAPRIIGRYYLNDKSGEFELITDIDKASKLIDKTILMRSAIYCKSTIGICKICFGQLAEKIKTKYIGIMSGGVINDIGVNLPHLIAISN